MKTHAIASLLASLAFTSGAFATTAPPPDASRLSARYSDWAGGKANADALVSGLTHGTSIALVTRGPGRTVSLAGFTAASPMTYSEAESALAGARRRLDGLGIAQPNAEQIQAAHRRRSPPPSATVMIEGRVARVAPDPASGGAASL